MSLKNKVLKMIERFEGDIVAIKKMSNTCTCIKKVDDSPNLMCEYCLGFGSQIQIETIRGVIQESDALSTVRGSSEFSITKEVFLKEHYQIKKDDYLIIENLVYQCLQIKKFRLENNEVVYKIGYFAPLKYISEFPIQRLRKMGVKI